ncbi:MAG: 4-hydroxy-3-methylbut-2-enyl diphosphate reductase [Nanoarchaeota archaeon]|nr:4-hydroxy-3-methylbut-2-enyl diphosphate reductase [Nanoarchaeota archaeon]
MKIICAENMGFCFGVKRALDIALKEKDAYTLGQLIHNPQVVGLLEERGIKETKSVDDIKRGTLIITAHGTIKSNIEKAKSKGLRIIDTTCPLVKRVHELAGEFDEKGYKIILFGDKEHPEVKGIVSNTKDVIIISSDGEVRKLKFDKACFLSQTTQSLEKFNEIADVLKKNISNLRIFNTICNATKKRQGSALKLAKKVDMMIVIGGYNSANTKMLSQICSKIVETKHIEKAGELDDAWFNGKNIIGLTAGASTPDWVIKNIKEKIEKY